MGGGVLIQGDCVEVLKSLDMEFDMVFADPPYRLSCGAQGVLRGVVSEIDKGEWDKCLPEKEAYDFDFAWIVQARESLKPNGTMWVCCTYHNIARVMQAMRDSGMHILDIIVWRKLNPPPRLNHYGFGAGAEFIVFARRSKMIAHTFNYELCRSLNGGSQMRDVWDFHSVRMWEKSFGRHPTQKPLAPVVRAILSCTRPGSFVLDPFCGAGTTCVAAKLCHRKFVGMDLDAGFLEIGEKRLYAIDVPGERELMRIFAYMKIVRYIRGTFH